MVISAIPSVIQSGKAIGPFALSLYMLSIGAALFKPKYDKQGPSQYVSKHTDIFQYRSHCSRSKSPQETSRYHTKGW